MVSTTIKSRENPAAVAKGFAATVVLVARKAPKAGPKGKATLKHAPTRAIELPLEASSLMSVTMATASWTLPSLNPPTIRLRRNVLKSTAPSHKPTLMIFPHMLHSSAVRRPYVSESLPIIGDARACRKENREPKAPPSRTMSYFDSIGIENACLYALR